MSTLRSASRRWGSLCPAVQFIIGLLLSASIGAARPALSEPELIDLVRALVVEHHFASPQAGDFRPASVASINEALQRLDPYSRYRAPKSDTPASAAGAPGPGFGVDLLPASDDIMVLPRKGGPLYQAGYRDPHILVSIDNLGTKAAALSEVGERLARAGETGQVRLGLRASTAAPVQRVHLQAAGMTRLPVEVLEIDDLSFIRIHEFRSHETRRALEAAIKALAAEQKGQVQQRLVLDLRYAGGGDLFEVMDAASLFLRGGLQLATVVDGDAQQQAYAALPNMQQVFRPVLLLIGPGTASASEVFVRALQRYGMAFSIGSETRGKCISQRRFQLPNGGQLTLSNRRILDPDGHYCAGRGMSPDLPVSGDKGFGNTGTLIRRGLDAMGL